MKQTVNNYKELDFLKEKISKMEEKITKLRIGRRILMNLIHEIERNRNNEINRLKRQIKQLRKNNKKYASILLSYHKRDNTNP
ncbi:MAG: hypothetical protein PWQ82_490 [Thermosediminibacterales bacterium]|nr:hypothetical protein [Thermosediminibacterales bacterium]